MLLPLPNNPNVITDKNKFTCAISDAIQARIEDMPVISLHGGVGTAAVRTDLRCYSPFSCADDFYNARQWEIAL